MQANMHSGELRETNDDDIKQHNKQAMVIVCAALPAVFLSSTAGRVVVVPALHPKYKPYQQPKKCCI